MDLYVSEPDHSDRALIVIGRKEAEILYALMQRRVERKGLPDGAKLVADELMIQLRRNMRLDHWTRSDIPWYDGQVVE